MAAKAETFARRIVFDLQEYTDGIPLRWASLDTITRRLVLIDSEAIDEAVAEAVANGWLLIEGGHSICLTDAGRRLIKP